MTPIRRPPPRRRMRQQAQGGTVPDRSPAEQITNLSRRMEGTRGLAPFYQNDLDLMPAANFDNYNRPRDERVRDLTQPIDIGQDNEEPFGNPTHAPRPRLQSLKQAGQVVKRRFRR